jgi:PleD family two-component response regulator
MSGASASDKMVGKTMSDTAAVLHTGTEESQPSGLTSHTLTVLLIDDQAMVGEAVRRMLAGEGDVNFHYCQDPTQAIRIATEIHPTVILQDLVMPEIDGLTLLRFFRANPATRLIPMIVLSTKEEPKIKAEAFALGANDYLVKLPDERSLPRSSRVPRAAAHRAGEIRAPAAQRAAEADRRAAQTGAKRDRRQLSGGLDSLRRPGRFHESVGFDSAGGTGQSS